MRHTGQFSRSFRNQTFEPTVTLDPSEITWDEAADPAPSSESELDERVRLTNECGMFIREATGD